MVVVVMVGMVVMVGVGQPRIATTKNYSASVCSFGESGASSTQVEISWA